MVRSNILRLLSTAALVAAFAGSAHARVLDFADASRIGNELGERWTREKAVNRAVATLLENEGIKENQAQQIQDGIDARAKSELRRYAASLEGQSFSTPEELKTVLAMRERILRFDAVSSPRAFALNRPMPYVATDAEITRIGHGLTATWIEHEPALREKLEEMVMMQDLDESDVPAVRLLARQKTIEHVKTILAGMRNAPFFSASDAEYYIDTAFDESIDRIRGESLADPVARASFLEEARNTSLAGQTSSLSVEPPARFARK